MISPMLSPSVSPLNPPPRRPNKSRLRAVSTIEQSSLSDTQDSSTTTSSNHSSMAPPEKSKYRNNKSIDPYFDDTSLILDEFILPPDSMPIQHQPLPIIRKDSIKVSKSLNTTTTKFVSQSNLSTDSLSNSVELSKQKIKVTPSSSTPLQMPTSNSSSTKLPTLTRKYSSNGSILSSVGHTKHNLTPGSLNRADVIISRLESWHLFLKSIIGWLEEVSKINMVSSRGYSQRAYSHLDESSGISTIKKGLLGGETNEKSIQSILTVQAGLHAITMQLATEQQELSQTIDKKFIPELSKLRKEAKDKAQKLKSDSSLILDELLRRAEVTRNKMTVLSRCCTQIDKGVDQVEIDPWVANLAVLHQLKREVEEENRLRVLLIPIQKEAQAFEQKVINAVKPAIEHCYKRLVPFTWDSTNEGSTPYQQLMDQISPLGDWEEFAEINKRDLVDEKNPKKDYRKINYPNKTHPSLGVLFKGKLEKKIGSRKQLVERNFVLTQGGYLHEFAADNRITPEKTVHIPSTTIIPSVDINQLTKDTVILDDDLTDLTFEICKPATNILQKDKIMIYKATTKDEFVDWCRILIQVSTGIQLSSIENMQDPAIDILEGHPISRISASRKQSTVTIPDISKYEQTPPPPPPVLPQINAALSEESLVEPFKIVTPQKAIIFTSQEDIEEQIDPLATTNFFIPESSKGLNNGQHIYEDNESGIIDDYFTPSKNNHKKDETSSDIIQQKST